MNAVNLIPGDYRRRSASLSASPVTLGVIGALVVVFAAAVLYVFAVNDVRSRQSELARVTANAASWQAAANSYSSYVTAAEQRKQQTADVRQLVSGRFPWSLLLSQIGGVMPANAALSNLSAQSPSAASTGAAGASGTTSTSPGSPTSVSTVSLNGCAASQSAVAATMVALRRVQGVGAVNLASTNNNGPSTGGSSSSSSQGGSGGGGCPFPVVFQMSLELAPAASVATSGSATPATAPAATATAATAGSSTGAAQ